MLRARLRNGLIPFVIAVVAAGGCGDAGKNPRNPRGGKKGDDASSKVLLQQARTAAKKGDDDRADELYADAYKKNHKFSILGEHVEFLIAARRESRAVEVAKAYTDESPDDIKGTALYAEALIEAGQVKESLDMTDSLLQLDDGSAHHHALRGRALLLTPETRDQGKEELRRSLEIDNKDPKVLIALGEALQKDGRVDEAALHLKSAVKLDPENARAYALLGAALRDQKEIDEAKIALRRAMELDPDSGRPYFEMGILHNQLAEQADAEKALSRAVDLDPEDTTYWYAYGQILHLRATQDKKAPDAGKLDLAINAYKRSLEIKPPHPKAAGKLAAALTDADRHDEAEILLTSLLRSDPDNAQFYVSLGAVYDHARKYKLAIDAYEKYLVIAPKSDPDRDRVKREIIAIKRKL